MSDYIDAGKLRDHIAILEFRESAPNVWQWQAQRKTWANVEAGTGRNLFSAVGIGARDAKLTLRKQSLTLHQALLWKGQHLFLTSIIPLGRQHLTVMAALVEPVDCKAETSGGKVVPGKGNRPVKAAVQEISFTGILTEKYVGYERNDTHAVAKTTYVLVTPKEIRLTEGDLVTVSNGAAAGVYDVQKCHWLDAYKNEYEITWQRDA